MRREILKYLLDIDEAIDSIFEYKDLPLLKEQITQLRSSE